MSRVQILFAGAYLLPLVGLIVYVGLSNRPKLAAAASSPMSGASQPS